MEGLLRYLQGWLMIRLSSRMPERFMKMCASRGILLWDIEAHYGNYELKLKLKDFWKLKEICRKSDSRIHILKKSGMPFFFYRNKKRKAFFTGIFCCILLLYLCSTRIWNIHIDGNYSNSTQSILKYLESKDIVHGIAKKDLNCSRIATDLRNQYKDITWVAAQIKGTRLLIHIQENILENREDTVQNQPCSIAAETDGTIIHMVTRSGVPQMQVGQQCKEGDILVLGRLEILNDSQEVVRYEYIQADADIYIQRTLSYYDEISLKYKSRDYTGRIRKGICLECLNLQACIKLPTGNYQNYDSVCTMTSLRLTENFVLPIRWGIRAEREYVQKQMLYSSREARELAMDHLKNYLEELSEKGVKIIENNVKICINDSSCISSGKLTVIEKTGQNVPVERCKESEERIISDEQQHN